MEIWKGRGVLKLRGGEQVSHGGKFEKEQIGEDLYNKLVDSGQVDGGKRPSGKPAGDK